MTFRPNLPLECQKQLVALLAANPNRSTRYDAVARASGQAIMHAALGGVVTSIEITQENGESGVEWGCLLNIETKQFTENFINPLSDQEATLAAALYTVGGCVGEYLSGAKPPTRQLLSDNYYVEFLCEQLDKELNMPTHQFYLRVANKAEDTVRENIGIYSALVDALESRDELRGDGVARGLSAVNKINLGELVGGLQ